MPWITVAILSPVLSALGSYTDKYLLVHHRQTGGLGSILIFSCFLGILVIPLALFFGGDPFSVSIAASIAMAINGGLTVASLAAYLYAMEKRDIISVAPVLQTIPVFALVLGYMLLGEALHMYEIIGAAFVIGSAILLSVEIEEEVGWTFNARSLLLALLSAFLFAFSGAVFKFFAEQEGYWTVQFWEYIGIALTGCALFMLVSSYRRGFVRVVRGHRVKVIALNVLTELLTVSADLIINYATLLAPIALVYTVIAFQPAFLLLYAFIGFILAPKLVRKLSPLRRHVLLKIVAVGVMIYGAVIIHNPAALTLLSSFFG